jgi:cellulose synthase/poly-beta-1,6-N-acetylglucosamine synthase-like glycosyltransferase
MKRFQKILDKNVSGAFGAVSDNFQIIIPVFNEQAILDIMLGHAKNYGYLKDLVIVNDASTDATYEILERWSISDGLKVFHLRENMKKEGAVKQALINLKENGEIKKYTVLLDADTYLDPTEKNGSIEEKINTAIHYLETNNLYGLALRLNAVYLNKPSIFWMSAYTTYIGIQFDNWLLNKQNQLWVINGAAGLFRTKSLLEIFDNMEFNFETGDLQITVELMKANKKIAFYKELLANSYVPLTLRQFFNQRRRWERGTTKVLWQDRGFYLSTLMPPTFISLALMIHLSIYVSFWVALISGAIDDYTWNWTIGVFIYSYFGWVIFDLAKGYYVVYKERYNTFGLYLMCELANSLVTLFVIMPARLYGGIEAVIYLLKKRIGMQRKRG